MGDFWRRVRILGPDDCWLWSGANSGRGGYGVFRYKHERDKAHRWAWRWEHGDIPEGLQVLHTCDTPACVNVRHLCLGTHLDNMQDRDNKGRNKPRTRATGSHKLTSQQADEIRTRWVPGRSGSLPGHTPNGNTAELAREYGVSRVMIWKIGTGRG